MHSFPAEVQENLIHLMSGLLLAGAALLAASLYFVRQLTLELGGCPTRKLWRLLGGLILLFVGGYLGLFTLKLGRTYTSSETLVVFIFFLGAIFALLVCLLALRTTRELKRVNILEQEAMTDPLLGIYNRRSLDRRLQDEVMRARRHGLDLMLLLVDLDNFKSVNDTWGHYTGDLVLQHVARLLVESLRQTDIVARYGGEEMVILLPHTPCAEGKMVGQRLRERIETTPVLVEGKEGVSEVTVTVSIGCACLHAAQDTPQSLLQRADFAMYQAKRQGRNRVVCAELEQATQPRGGVA